MITGVYRFAGITACINTTYSYLHDRCSAYRTDGLPQLTISITQEDIAFEHEMARREAMAEKIPFRDFTDEVCEFTAVYRQLVEAIASNGIFLMHGSAIAVNRKAFLFTAKSGTGKSTHTRLWREYLGDCAVMINDDKPLISVLKGAKEQYTSAVVYGTPWDGKHHLSTNIHVPLGAICVLERAAENHIQRVNTYEVLPLLLQQVYRPRNAEALRQVMASVNQVVKTVPIYRLRCNMDISAAQIAYEAMTNTDLCI